MQKLRFSFANLGCWVGLVRIGSFCFAEGSACVSGQNKMCQKREENYFLKCAVGKFLKPFVSACVLVKSRSIFVGLQRKCLSVFVRTVDVSTVALRLQPTGHGLAIVRAWIERKFNSDRNWAKAVSLLVNLIKKTKANSFWRINKRKVQFIN